MSGHRGGAPGLRGGRSSLLFSARRPLSPVPPTSSPPSSSWGNPHPWVSDLCRLCAPLRPRGHRRRRGRERLLHEAKNLCPRSLGDRLEASELEPHELYAALRTDGLEAEVRQEVPREHSAVHDEP